MSFSTLGLSATILDALKEQGYTSPTPIQAQAIPAILAGKDVMAAAQTGTGKTAGFTLPILERLAKGKPAGANQARALILTPTRELAAQVAESVALYSKGLNLTSAVVFGGVKINPQMMRLRKGVDILVATPGRLMDLHNQNAVKFTHLEVLVLDEADRMLDMGFIHDIKKIMKVLPPKRQSLLFSATFSDDIRKLARGLVNNPVEISVTPPNAAAPSVEQIVYKVEKSLKPALLVQLIRDKNWFQVLVFTKTKHGANKLTQQIEAAGFKASAIHGSKSQGARTKALAGFKDGSIQILVATDIAARGLDIDQLPQVVNFELPNVSEDYVHRIGRTGRAGATGHAISLVSQDEEKLLRDIERLIKKNLVTEKLPEITPLPKLPPRERTNPQPARRSNASPAGQRSARAGSGAGAAQKPAARNSRNRRPAAKSNGPKAD